MPNSGTELRSQGASRGAGGLARVVDSLDTLLLAAVIVCAFFTVVRTYVRMHSPFEMDYAEGTILNAAWRTAQGGALYQPLRGIPYQIDPYPPFIYKLSGAVLKH